MKIANLKGFKKINDYVDYKMKLLEDSDGSMEALYGLMFSERENVAFEESDGFKIRKKTYGETYDEVESISASLRAAIGGEVQSIVGLYMKNSAEWIVSFWALLKAGYRPVLLNSFFSDETLDGLLKDLNAVAVVSDGRVFGVKTIIANEVYKSEKKADGGEWGKEFFVLSSGTQSLKVCAYGAEQLVNTIRNSKQIIKSNGRIKEHYDGQLKLLAFLPFYHIFGFVALYVWFAFYSRTFVILKDHSPATIRNAIRRHRVTHVFAVPLFWNGVYKKAIEGIKKRGEKTFEKARKAIRTANALGGGFLGRAFSAIAFKELRENIFGDSVKFMITGGGAIDKDVLIFFNAIGYHLVNGYGTTETGITSVELSDDRKKIVGGSIGKPLLSAEYKIKDGVLWVKCSSAAKYVSENGKRTNVCNEWFNTRDLCFFKNGSYYLAGRADDLIVSSSGENLNPLAIEQALGTDNINELCLINGRDGELPVLLASVSRSLPVREAENVLSRVKAKMVENNLIGQIGRVVFIEGSLIGKDEFKINRARIEKRYRDGGFKPFSFEESEDKTDDEIVNKIRSYFSVALNKPVESIRADTDFFLDEGGTSLDYFAMAAKLQEDFSVSFPSVAGESLRTVNDFANYLKDSL